MCRFMSQDKNRDATRSAELTLMLKRRAFMWHVQCDHCPSDCDLILSFTVPTGISFLDFQRTVAFLGLFFILSSECDGHLFFIALFSFIPNVVIFYFTHTHRVAANFNTSAQMSSCVSNLYCRGGTELEEDMTLWHLWFDPCRAVWWKDTQPAQTGGVPGAEHPSLYLLAEGTVSQITTLLQTLDLFLFEMGFVVHNHWCCLKSAKDIKFYQLLALRSVLLHCTHELGNSLAGFLTPGSLLCLVFTDRGWDLWSVKPSQVKWANCILVKP